VAAAGYPIASRSSPWLHGPASDLLLGAGLAYIVSLPVLLLLGDGLGLEGWPTEAVILMAFAANAPHYGATLLRVYEQPDDRRKYAFFTIHVSLALLAVFVLGLRVAWIGALLMTLYFSWSPWHFAGQNYGLTLMFVRRSGVEVPAAAKRALYVAFILSFLLTFLVFHSRELGTPFAPDFSASSDTYEILRLGIPTAITLALTPLLVAGFLGALAWAAVGLRRAGAGRRELGLVASIALTQFLWFTVPAAFAITGRPLTDLAFAAVWASTAHSVQYLWVTSYFAKRAGTDQRLLPYYAKALLAGSLIAVAPGVLAARLVGSHLSWSGGLAILVFSVVNLHHFILDGAIWKLRDGRVARLLLRGGEPAAQETGARRSPWRALVWAAGLACLVVPFLDLRATQAVRARDLSALEASTRQLAWFGRERMSVLSTLGELYAVRGENALAERTFRDALAVRRDPTVLNNLAWLLSIREGDPERAAEAVRLAEEAVVALGADDYQALDTLAAAYAAAGRYGDAREVGARALALAEAQAQDAELAATLASRLALYRADRPYRIE
jgi:hypothetical protein